ncbi:MAG: glutamine--tRNA ligase/YqeY domain fusion protein [Thermoplasmata archaeon]|nr:glutamine--tRNA ligase/YqeY domain fusion protein [Thermoplasmata archaeon]
MEGSDPRKTDFIREIIDEDIRADKHGGRVHTRFPPEPNGYLHIGHAKSICLNFGIAEEYGGKCNLRFDDTNPSREEEEYVESIKEDVKWLGFDWEDRLYFASDYFGRMYDLSVDLVRNGNAYVDDLTGEEIRQYRGNLTTPGRESPFRDRPVEENLDLLERMRKGEFKDGEKVLRARIDMAHPNMNMRDPVIYRILKASHHNTGDKWCIYPMYDWAHGLEDSIEDITHSLCTLEFENHRPLYDWFLDHLDVYHPQQIEFARLNLTFTVMSKRKLLQLVENKLVTGWNDPRMPTISGMRRRGYPASSIREFCSRIGVAKINSTISFELLEHCVREDLNRTSPRSMGVLDPLKVTIENLPDDHEDLMEVKNNPEDPGAGTRSVPFSNELFIERSDFLEDPPRKFFRLSPGKEVRLRNAYLVTCTDVVKEGGEVVELICRADLDSRGGDAPDGRKVKGTLHWVSAKHAVEAEVRLYGKLFTVEDPLGVEGDFTDHLDPGSLNVLNGCKVEPSVREKRVGASFQFERLGYFMIDPDTTDDRLVINRTITLRDSWAKIQKK